LRTLKGKKGQLIQRQGELDSKVYKVESGLLRSYSIDDKGKEHIYMFASENWIIADNCEATSPCELFIDVLEDSVLFVFDKEKIMENADVHSFVKRLFTLQHRIIKLMSSNAIERYEHFVETYPDIVQRVPQRMIASYLGVTPEALSRVRKVLSLRN
jgi:CRP-like cAMP-binding protein|tara:strand:+ start:1469 stop:1939 length:471 start_codon:yes stop_codon:yes gene_type:complete